MEQQDELYARIGPRFREWMKSGANKPFMTPMSPRVNLTMAEVADEVADYYKWPRQQLLSQRRDQLYVSRRYLAMRLITRKCLGKSYAQIGRFFNMNRKTIMHGVNMADKLLRTDTKFANDYDAIEALL